jgi:hypothetical protein
MTKEYLFGAFDIISKYPEVIRTVNEKNDSNLRFTARDRLVLERLSFHASRGGIFRAGYARIGLELGYTVKTIGRAFANLKELGLIAKIRNGGGGFDDLDEFRTTASEWQLQFQPMQSLPDCFGNFFARKNYSLKLEQQAREKRLEIEAQERADHPEKHAADLDWSTTTIDEGAEELSEVP